MSILRTQFPTRKVSLLTLLGLAACTLSCSVVIDTKKKQCSVDADCTSLGTAFADTVCDPDQSVCVPGVKGALGCDEAPETDGDVTLSFDIGFLNAPADPKPTVVRVCDSSTDFLCMSPRGKPITVPFGETAQIPVPSGYQGILEVKNPDGLPALYFLGRPINQDTHGYDLTLSTPATATLLGLVTQQDVDPDLGIVIITTRDCAREPLSDVAVSGDFTDAIQFYFQNRTPVPSLMATTAEGASGYANVPERVVTISGVHDGRPLTPSVGYARGGWVTYMELFP